MKPKYKVGDELVFRVDEVHDKGYTLSPGGGTGLLSTRTGWSRCRRRNT